jgi:hypothetical protein
LFTLKRKKPNFRIVENLSNDNSKFVEPNYFNIGIYAVNKVDVSDIYINIKHSNNIFIIQGCLTKDGPDPNKPCVFPFIDRGISLNKCTIGSLDRKPWCPTEVDQNGHYIDEKWGNCDSNCEIGNTGVL